MKVEPKAGTPAKIHASEDRPSRSDSRDDRRADRSAGRVIRDVERYLRDGKLSNRESARIERRLERDRNLSPEQRKLASSFIDKAASDGRFSRSEKNALRELFHSDPTPEQKDTLSRFLDRAFKDDRLDRNESRAFEKMLKSDGGVDEKLTSSVLDRLQKDGRMSNNEGKLLDRVLNGEVDGERRFLRNLDRAYRDGHLSDRELRRLSRQIEPVEHETGEIQGSERGPQPPICRPPRDEGRPQVIHGAPEWFRNHSGRDLSPSVHQRIQDWGFPRRDSEPFGW